MPIEDGQRAMLLGVEEREALLQMRVRKAQFAQQEPSSPQRVVRLQKARRVVSLLRQLQTLLAQLARRLVRPPPVVELPESTQDGEELGRLAHALTERPRSRIGVFRLGGGKTLRHHQRRTQGGLQEELLLDA